MGKYRNFSDGEVEGLDERLVSKLDDARDVCGFPFKITSGLRQPEANANIGGVPNSSHLKGLAADLARPTEYEPLWKMIWALGLSGFKRIEIATRHIHVDIDDSKPSPVMWYGESK